jgi:hypothetical protein
MSHEVIKITEDATFNRLTQVVWINNKQIHEPFCDPLKRASQCKSV